MQTLVHQPPETSPGLAAQEPIRCLPDRLTFVIVCRARLRRAQGAWVSATYNEGYSVRIDSYLATWPEQVSLFSQDRLLLSPLIY